ncbi:hypothetical protein NHX12_031137 [Muraenolepis orangiensis]|uniref:Uncharacterized protein n=1 Tax=Muraenolepis orangiensis TaxID=630683 RepID=A0A9Q0EDG8_9TELE|nr:hypothetical protein NHX12_031137 [Muraenolepis orangiensis]
MTHLLTRPTVLRPLTFATEETQALHSWSRVSSAGQSVVLEALKILGPKLGTTSSGASALRSTRRTNSTVDLPSPGVEKVLGVGARPRELPSTQELLIFLQELREEGHQATVLRSKDVYGYRSTLSCPLTQDKLRALEKSQRPAAKRRGRKPLARKREVHPSWRRAQRSSPRIQGICPPEAPLYVSRLALEAERRAPQPCLRLTSIQGLPGAPTARLQIHTSSELSSGPHTKQRLPPTPALSGIPLHPSQTNGGAPVALRSHRGLSCPVRHDGALIGDSAPVLYGPFTVLGSNGAHRPQGSSSRRVLNSLRRKVIKVDHSQSVADARRKAQKILQLDLSPVIHIQPLPIRDYQHLQ